MADCSATGKDMLDGYRARPLITNAFQLTYSVSNMEVGMACLRRRIRNQDTGESSRDGPIVTSKKSPPKSSNEERNNNVKKRSQVAVRWKMPCRRVHWNEGIR